jgi:hypothetical protein
MSTEVGIHFQGKSRGSNLNWADLYPSISVFFGAALLDLCCIWHSFWRESKRDPYTLFCHRTWPVCQSWLKISWHKNSRKSWISFCQCARSCSPKLACKKGVCLKIRKERLTHWDGCAAAAMAWYIHLEGGGGGGEGGGGRERCKFVAVPARDVKRNTIEKGAPKRTHAHNLMYKHNFTWWA